MRRETRDEAKARADANSLTAHRLSIALNAMMDKEAIFLCRSWFEGVELTAYAAGLERCCGGVLILRSKVDKQKPYTVVYGAEEWLAERRRYVPAGFTAEVVAYNKVAELLQRAMARNPVPDMA